MRSVKIRLLILLFSISIILTLLLGSTCLIFTNKTVKSDANDIITNVCESESKNINKILLSVEQSVDIMGNIAVKNLTSLQQLKDEDTMEAYNQQMVETFLEICKHTDTFFTIYYRYNIEMFGPSAGFWYGLENGVMTKLQPTNLSLFDKYDIQNAAWYHLPYENRKACWIEPFLNEDLNSYVISYSTPIYFNNQFVGVIGMEIDFANLISKVNEIDLSENSTAFIVNKNDKIIYHESIKFKQNRPEVPKDFIEVESKLNNDMTLVISAPINEISETGNAPIVKIYVYFSIFLALQLGLIGFILIKMLKPLDTITETANQISNGNYNVNLDIHSKDQFYDIANGFNSILEEYNDRIESVNKLAFKDQLTGVFNKIAYADHSLRINKNIGRYPFAVVVLHFYNLIPMNEKYGREMGNEFLLSATSYIESSFSESNIYRLTGGLFAVILENEQFDNKEKLCENFIDGLAEQTITIEQEEIGVPIAIGMAVYNKNKDKSVGDVYARADRFMQTNRERSKNSQSE